jgi:16S rRNA (guanine527-N7)-methyltransferase
MRLVTTAGPETGPAPADPLPARPLLAASGSDSGAGVPGVAREVFGAALPAARRYADMLTGPGITRGLIGPREAERVWERHLLNCAVVAPLIPQSATLLDIGSGAGLPGIVLAMLLPDAHVTLLEPMARRVTFLDECVMALGLRNVSVRRGRAEEVRGQFSADVVTARAVAPLDRLAGLALPLVRRGGMVLALKGDRAAAEADAARPLLRRLGVTETTVLQAGAGTVAPAATVVRLIAGPAPARRRKARTGR